jgi:hypothetical protein
MDYEMEVDEQPIVLANQGVEINGENPFAQMDNIANEQPVKKRAGPRTFTDVDFCQNPQGINALYT